MTELALLMFACMSLPPSNILFTAGCQIDKRGTDTLVKISNSAAEQSAHCCM
jgi:hypothetical protein